MSASGATYGVAYDSEGRYLCPHTFTTNSNPGDALRAASLLRRHLRECPLRHEAKPSPVEEETG